MKIILASASPRRRLLLKNLFDDFEIIVPNADENASGEPIDYVKEVAFRKAKAIQESADLIIAADTIVVYDNKIIGKPRDAEDAINTLTTLSGKMHHVHTGVTLFYKDNNELKHLTFCDTSNVFLKNMNLSEIKKYVATGSPLDKAGSYGIQDGVVEKYEGSYTNIVGLPIEKLEQALKIIKIL